MNITCNRQLLSETANHISRVIPATSAIPALSGILLVAEQNLTLSGYDLEIGITKTIDARVAERGRVVFDAKLFCDIVRRLPEDTVTISVDDRLVCEIFSGKSHFSLMGINADEFPEMPSVEMGKTVSLPSETLQSMVRQTIFSVAPADANKPLYTGLMYEIKGGMLNMIAVDGFRLAIRKEKIAYEGDLSFIVPSKTMNEVTKLISTEEDVTMSVTDRHIIFTVDGFNVISRLLVGEFLNYETAIPKNCSTKVQLNTREMISSVERVSQIILERIKTTPLRCKFENDLFVASCNTELGSAQDEVSVKIEGQPVEIGFNNRYLLDALKATETDEVVFELGGSHSPAVVRPINGDHFLFIVMPVKLA